MPFLYPWLAQNVGKVSCLQRITTMILAARDNGSMVCPTELHRLLIIVRSDPPHTPVAHSLTHFVDVLVQK